MSVISLVKYFRTKIKRTLFTTPTHSQDANAVSEAKKMLGAQFFKLDYSEIEGFDNLAKPENAIKDLEEKIAAIYNSGASFPLINGSTSGILALMLATLAPNDKVLINRNCHQSVISGLILTGAYPVWLQSETVKEWNVVAPISAEIVQNAIAANSNIKALIVTNPTYEGLYTNLEEIAKICEHNNIIFIVDEAHGALWNFYSKFPKTAIQCGAHASVQSLHKNAGAVTPCALLHLAQNSKISAHKVQNALNLINTSSPSYPLLIDIEATVDFLNSNKGSSSIDKLLKNIDDFRKSLLEFENISIYCYDNDITKILIKIENTSGVELAELLEKKYNIEVEIAGTSTILCLTGIGTKNSKLKKLEKAIRKIVKNNELNETTSENDILYLNPQIGLTPQKAYQSDYVEIEPQNSIGSTSKETLTIYPPGIPVIIAGEVIQEGHLEYLKANLEKIKVCK